MPRTALRFPVLTAIPPPKLLISRRAPARTGTVVSVCCVSVSAVSVARVVSMLVCPPPSFARRRVSPLGAGAPVYAASLWRGAGSDMNSRGRPRARSASCGTVKENRLTTGRCFDRADSPIRAATAGQRSAAGGRSSSARAFVTTRRSSSSVVRQASHEGRCASSAVRSGPASSPSTYSESRSVHWSVIVPAPSALEMPAERHAGMMQLRFRRAGHDPQHVGDLLVPVPLDIVQHEHLPRAVGQAPDGLLEVHRQLRRRRAPRHPVEDVGRVVIAAALCAEGGAPGEDDVHRQAVQPCPERLFAPERRELGPCTDEYFQRV